MVMQEVEELVLQVLKVVLYEDVMVEQVHL
jgi:hypothetical protein